jgi:hypothetical protein
MLTEEEEWQTQSHIMDDAADVRASTTTDIWVLKLMQDDHQTDCERWR